MLSPVRLCATPRIVARQAPLSTEFSRQEYWRGLPFPTPRDLSNLLIRALTPSWGLHPHHLVISPSFPLKMLSHWGFGFQCMDFGGHNNSVHSHSFTIKDTKEPAEGSKHETCVSARCITFPAHLHTSLTREMCQSFVLRIFIGILLWEYGWINLRL